MEFDELVGAAKLSVAEPAEAVRESSWQQVAAVMDRERGPEGRRVRPRRAAYLIPVAVAAVVAGLALQALGGAPSRRDPGSVETLGESQLTVVDSVVDVGCGLELPIAVEVQQGSTGPIESPLPGFERSKPSQLVRHWVTGDVGVELRWPADSQPLYGSSVASSSSLTRVVTGSKPQSYDIYVFDAIDRVASGENRKESGVLRLTAGSDFSEFDPGCRTIQFRAINGAGEQHTHAFRVNDPGTRIDLDPLIVAESEVTELPSDAVLCEGRDPVSHAISLDDRRFAITPAEALQSYLLSDSNLGRTPALPTSGYTEMTSTNNISYGVPRGGYPGYNVLVALEKTESGWSVARTSRTACP